MRALAPAPVRAGTGARTHAPVHGGGTVALLALLVLVALVALGGAPAAGAAQAAPGVDPATLVERLESAETRTPAVLDLLGWTRTLEGARSEPWLRFVEALDRLPGRVAVETGRALLLADDGGRTDPTARRRGSDALVGLAGTAEGPATAALLSLAAHLVEAADPPRALALRQRIRSDHPDTPEAPEATVAVARTLLATPAGRAEALALLDAFLLARPEHPLAPEARRLRSGGQPPGAAPR
jgi:hypothetical protein